jgi:ribosomal 50S subunit-recycling heat shock protein
MNQRVEINGRSVKPSHEVNAGDIVAVTFGNRRLEIKVLSTQEVQEKSRCCRDV